MSIHIIFIYEELEKIIQEKNHQLHVLLHQTTVPLVQIS